MYLTDNITSALSQSMHQKEIISYMVDHILTYQFIYSISSEVL